MTLKNKIYKFVTSKSKSKYIYKLPKTVKQCKSAVYKTSKMKPAHIQSILFINLDVEINIKTSKFRRIVHVQISNYGNIFPTGYKQTRLVQLV